MTRLAESQAPGGLPRGRGADVEDGAESRDGGRRYRSEGGSLKGRGAYVDKLGAVRPPCGLVGLGGIATDVADALELLIDLGLAELDGVAHALRRRGERLRGGGERMGQGGGRRREGEGQGRGRGRGGAGAGGGGG